MVTLFNGCALSQLHTKLFEVKILVSSSGSSYSGSLLRHSGHRGKAQLKVLEIQVCVLVILHWETLESLPLSLEESQKPGFIVNLELLTWETAS